MKVILYGLIIVFALACNTPKEKPKFTIDETRLKKRIEEVQQPAIVMENDEINAYIKQHALNMKTTGAGLRYQFLKTNPQEELIITKNEVKINYKVSLLTGAVCYSSEKDGPKTFLVDFDQVESGLHLAIKMMRKGERAIFILPAHLAHGLIGDGKKIPPKAALVYEVEVLAVKSL